MRIARRLGVAALVLLILVAGWSFAGRNAVQVPVYLFFVEFEQVALWVALIVAFGCGAAAVGLYATYELAKARLLARRYRRAVIKLEGELHQLRNLPLSGTEEAKPEPLIEAPAAGGVARTV